MANADNPRGPVGREAGTVGNYCLAAVIIVSLLALFLATYTQGFSLDNGLVYGAF